MGSGGSCGQIELLVKRIEFEDVVVGSAARGWTRPLVAVSPTNILALLDTIWRRAGLHPTRKLSRACRQVPKNPVCDVHRTLGWGGIRVMEDQGEASGVLGSIAPLQGRRGHIGISARVLVWYLASFAVCGSGQFELGRCRSGLLLCDRTASPRRHHRC